MSAWGVYVLLLPSIKWFVLQFKAAVDPENEKAGPEVSGSSKNPELASAYKVPFQTLFVIPVVPNASVLQIIVPVLAVAFQELKCA